MLVLVWVPNAAGAHSALIDSCPFAGDVVNDIDSIELSFAAPLVENSDPPPTISLAGDLGRTDIEVGAVEFLTETELRVAVPAELQPGLYIVRYSVVSADGDDNDGGFDFTLDPDATEAAACRADASSGGAGVGRWVLLGVGVVALAALGLLLRPRRSP